MHDVEYLMAVLFPFKFLDSLLVARRDFDVLFHTGIMRETNTNVASSMLEYPLKGYEGFSHTHTYSQLRGLDPVLFMRASSN